MYACVVHMCYFVVLDDGGAGFACHVNTSNMLDRVSKHHCNTEMDYLSLLSHLDITGLF